MNETLHIGKLIQQKMDEDGRKVTWLAKKIPCHRNNIYQIYQQEHIHPALLSRISTILKFNFFSYYYDDINERILKENNKG